MVIGNLYQRPVQKFTLARMDSLESALRTKNYMEKYYNDDKINKEICKYIASKLIYNIEEIIKFKKANKIDVDVEKKILCVIKDNRKFIQMVAKKVKEQIIDMLMKDVIQKATELAQDMLSQMLQEQGERLSKYMKSLTGF